MAESELGPSPLAEALARVGDRWTLLVVEALLPGPQRFNELLSLIPGIAANILSTRLKQLERDGLVARFYFGEVPPRVEYEITPLGASLAPVFASLVTWSGANLDQVRVARAAYDKAGKPLP